MCEQAYANLQYEIYTERSTFELIEQNFHLHAGTVTALQQHKGVFFRSFAGKCASGGPKHLQIVVKSASKVGVTAYLLSTCYDFDSGFTTALLIGTGVTTRSMSYTSEENPIEDTTLLSMTARQSSQIKALIKSVALCWHHPTILPVLILQHHTGRANAYSNSLDKRIFEDEQRVGVAFPGRQAAADKGNFTTRTREQLASYTASIHANVVQVMFDINIYSWSSGCCEFVLDLHNEVARSAPAFDETSPLTQEMRGAIEHIMSATKSTQQHVATLKDRAQSQLALVSTAMPFAHLAVVAVADRDSGLSFDSPVRCTDKLQNRRFNEPRQHSNEDTGRHHRSVFSPRLCRQPFQHTNVRAAGRFRLLTPTEKHDLRLVILLGLLACGNPFASPRSLYLALVVVF